MNKTELKDALVILLNDHVCLDRENCETECSACMADHLIANGVTVQRWIPVTDRLPDVVSTHKWRQDSYTKSIRVLAVCLKKDGKRMVKEGWCQVWSNLPKPRWKIPGIGTGDSVTHWAYLPEPPGKDVGA